MPIKKLDLTGQRSGMLVAIEPTEHRNAAGNVMWRCRCDCGNECEVSSQNIKLCKTKSCGCATKKFITDKSTVTSMKRRTTKANTSGKVGVTWVHKRGVWRAQIGIKENGRSKNIFLGYYYRLTDAIRAREQAEALYFAPVIRKYDEEHKK